MYLLYLYLPPFTSYCREMIKNRICIILWRRLILLVSSVPCWKSVIKVQLLDLYLSQFVPVGDPLAYCRRSDSWAGSNGQVSFPGHIVVLCRSLRQHNLLSNCFSLPRSLKQYRRIVRERLWGQASHKGGNGESFSDF